MNLKDKIDNEIFHLVGETADEIGRECYVVGGYVRDIILQRNSKDIDFVTVGSGIELAEALAKKLGKRAKVAVYRNFGTAQLHFDNTELEFVGARRESYNRNSRKPIVEDGTLDDDLSRRDFTINALAICVNKDRFGEVIDKFDGLHDMNQRTIRTPLNPDITFSDDPLRMLRAIRFATQLKFKINYATFDALARNADRINIISKERIYAELTKIMQSTKPSIGWMLLSDCGLLKIILPELEALKGVDAVNGRTHKDNFYHTLQVLDKVAEKSDNVWLRWAALFHDIGKGPTKRWVDGIGWTFHNHNYTGAKMLGIIFRRLKFPLDEKLKYVQKLVELHMRPINLVEDIVTDSAVRRMMFDAGEDIEDLMILCEADITSKNSDKVKRFLDNYALVRNKMIDLEERDRIRIWQPPINGNDIMQAFGIGQCHEVGVIKQYIKESLLDSDTPNDRELAWKLMVEKGSELGLSLVQNN
ncbi:MAG: CCA tRNA nucleotidyltransferase [Muribaculaceae bacterium]